MNDAQKFMDGDLSHNFGPVGDRSSSPDRSRSSPSCRDVIDFAAPYGVLGWLLTEALLHRYLRRLIESRNSYLVSSLAGGSDPP
ncbi:hypothetical protein [Micromonospora sp. NPDC005367]|uniref:hypothetical protein n=1 Tax=Micromonospora sp. NPDC005367 TaxID=3155590 RepID=UPI0033AB684B